MKVYKNVRSTAEYVPAIEVNTNYTGAIDTVYIRSNITKIQGEDREEWNIGEEIQYDTKEFLTKISLDDDTGMLALLVSMLMSEIDMLNFKINQLEGGN